MEVKEYPVSMLKLLILQRKSLHRPIHGDGGMSFSVSLPVVHYQIVCFADIEMEVDVWHQDVSALTSSM